MDPATNSGTLSFVPPKKTFPENLAWNFRMCVQNQTCIYKARELEQTIQEINVIVQEVLKHSNQKQKLEEGNEKAWKPHKDDREGRACFRGNPTTFAYKFILKAQNFNGNVLNIQILNEGIEDLKHEAIVNRGVAELLAQMKSDPGFEPDPVKYVEAWRQSINKPSEVQLKVIEMFEVSAEAAKDL